MDFRTIQQAGLDELLDMARAKYEVGFEPVNAGGVHLDVLQIKNMAEVVESITENAGEELNLPFWAMIWPASIILGHITASLPGAGKKTVLEVGAGIGVAGMIAAAKGFDTVISDMDKDALLFSRINILHNQLQDKARVAMINFSNPLDSKAPRYDYVLGAEVIYRNEVARPLCKFLKRSLARNDEAEAIMAADYHRKCKKFFSCAADEFHIQDRQIGMTSSDDTGDPQRKLITIYRLKPRKRS